MQGGFGKPPRPNKLSAKNLNTVTLGLQYSTLNERETPNSYGKSENIVYPTTYSLSNVFGSNTQNFAKHPNQKWKERPGSSKGIFTSHQPARVPCYGSYNALGSLKQKQPIQTTLGGYTNTHSMSKPVSPFEPSDMEKKTYKLRDGSKIQKTQVCLAGDHVIFAESSSVPGVPIIYRLEDERQNNLDKLNLDRRKLQVCPILEDEENLRLLNFQHNSIRKIQHLSMLKKLIFLDFYDNQLEEISGLSSLKALRVLMLGKNRIRKINNLQEIVLLDVLDLHGNKISAIENLSHLRHLRVLNLAGNELTAIRNLCGLESLSELNLRRNYIQTIHDMDKLPSLQRLFLSFNEIKSFDDINCLTGCSQLIEISLDGNPIASSVSYKQLILQNIVSLKQMDMKRVTEEEKRIAYAMARKEQERKKEQERLSSIKEKRRLAINNAQRQWFEQTKGKNEIDFTTYTSSTYESEIEELQKTSPSKTLLLSPKPSSLRNELTDFSACHLAELDNDTLNLYGPESLNALEKNWGDQSNHITTIVFKYISFDDIVPHISKLHSRFPSVSELKFEATNITCLNDINAFAVLKQLDRLYITEKGNPVTSLMWWRPYILFRLGHLNLHSVNGDQIKDADVDHAKRLFGNISTTITTKLPPTRLKLLPAAASSACGDIQHEPCLSYISKHKQQKLEEHQSFAVNYISDILHTAIAAERKQKMLDNMLPQLFSDVMAKYIKQISLGEEYCEKSLEKIKKSVNVVTT